MSNVLEITNAGHVRKLRLNRLEKKNALSDELAWGIISAVEEAAKDDDVWVIAITGTDDAFCSGLDLSPSGNGTHPYLSAQDALLDDLGWVSRFPLVLREQCDKPIVAGINGVAVGAGLSLAMAADIRLASESVRLIAGYPRIGGSPDGGLSFTLAQAMRFLLENRTVGAEEALKLGMVGEIVPQESFGERFDEYCQSLTELSPITARLTKRVVRRATAMADPESQYRYELQNIRRAFTSEDGREAGKAFREKRTPEFKGR